MMEKNLVIGIEGLVGAGKTSICRELLRYIPNSIVLHAGHIYRAIVAWRFPYEETDRFPTMFLRMGALCRRARVPCCIRYV